MALEDEVQTRYSAQKLANLTNPDSPGTTSVNAARLALAARDAEAEFKAVVGVAYDTADADHVAVAVDGVIYQLLKYSNLTADVIKLFHDDWVSRLEQLARSSGGRDRPVPSTNSILAVTSETAPDGGTVRPDFDRGRFARFIPKPPAA